MQQPGKDIFARPVLALQQNRDSRPGSPFQLYASSGHHGRLPEDHIHRRQIANIVGFGGAYQRHFYSILRQVPSVIHATSGPDLKCMGGRHSTGVTF